MANDFGGMMNPETMAMLSAAGGLLQAGGPSRQPTSLGQGLSQGLMGGMQGYQQANQFQTQQLQQKMMMEKLKKEMQQQEALAALYGKGAQPQGMPSAGAGQTSPDMAGVPMQNPSGGPSLDQLGALAASGVKIDDLLGVYKLQHPDMQVHGGFAYDPRTITPGFIPQAQITPQGQGVSMMPGAPGSVPTVAPLPGSLDTAGQFADVGEAAKARRDPMMGVLDAQGRPTPMTRESFSQTYGGVNAPAGGVDRPLGQTSDVFGYAPTEPDALAKVQAAAKKGQTATFSVDPSRSGGMGPTPAASVAAKTAAEGDAKRVLELEAKIPSLLSVSRRLDRMAALNHDDNTYAAAGAELKTTLGSIAQSFGLNVNQAKTANSEEYLAHVAELLKDRLATKDYGSGTGISNLDLLSAQKPLPELAKTAQGRTQLINALKADAQRNLGDAQAARDYFDENQGLRNFRFPSEVDAEKQKLTTNLPKTPGTPPAGKVLKYDPVTRTFK